MRATETATRRTMAVTAMSRPNTTARTATRAGRTTRSKRVSTAISTMSAALAGHSAPSLLSELASPVRSSAIRLRLAVVRARMAPQLVTHADRPRTRVRSDHRTELHHLERMGHLDPGEELEEDADVVRLPARHGQAFEGGVPLGLGRQVLERAAPRPLLGLLVDDAVADLDHGLDREHGSEQRPGLADPTTAHEVIERSQRAVDAGPAPRRLGRGAPRAQARAPRRCVGGRDRQQALAHGDRTGVEDGHLDAAGRGGRGGGRL